MEGKLGSCVQPELDFYLSSCTNLNSKTEQRPKKYVKSLEENRGETLSDLGLGAGFLVRSLTAQKAKARIDHWKAFVLERRQSAEWRLRLRMKASVSSSDKVLKPRTQEELHNLSIQLKEKNNLNAFLEEDIQASKHQTKTLSVVSHQRSILKHSGTSSHCSESVYLFFKLSNKYCWEFRGKSVFTCC